MSAVKARTAPSPRRAADELSRCAVTLVMREPFFGHLLGGIARQVTDGTPTLAVEARQGRIRLLVNAEFFLGLRSHNVRVAAVKHEALHLLFKHVLRMRGRPERVDPHLWNVAADLVVNQFIRAPWKLPESAITLATFPDLGLEPDGTVDAYYGRLVALREAMRKATGEGTKSDGTRGAGESKAGAKPRASSKTSSEGGKGAPGTQTPSKRSASEWADAGVSAPRSAESLDSIADWHSDHGHWSEGDDGLDGTAESIVDGMVARAAERVGPSGWSELPGPLRQLVEAAIERRRPQIDWRRALRMFSNSSRRTRIVSTNRRASRRYGSFPGIRVRRHEKLAVALDTSGSVRDEDLAPFFSEVHGLWRQGADVTVFECDARVQRSYRYEGRVPKAVAGRGGTLFDPVFAALREDRSVLWDGLVYLTDGHAPAPTLKPPCRLLWVLTPDGREGEHLRFGRVVRLPR